jgi:Cu2+-exporting ATPase
VILVEGMTCGMCEKHVKEALEKLPGIVSASADHTSGRVTVTYTDLPPEDLIRDAVALADYDYRGMEGSSDKAVAPRSAVLLVDGMMCEMCEKHVKEALEALDGIVSASADHASGRVTVTYTALPDEADIRAALEAADYTYAGIEAAQEDPVPLTKTVRISGMSCSHCENAVKKALEAVEGVVSASVSHEEGTAEITLSGEVPGDVLKAAVEAEGYTVTDII